MAVRPAPACPAASGGPSSGAVVGSSRGPDGSGTDWDAVAVASRRAVADLVRSARARAADGVVGVRLTTGADGVRASGLLVRRGPVDRQSALDDDPDDVFATHLPFDAAALAVEAGLRPRRLLVTAVRAALHVGVPPAGVPSAAAGPGPWETPDVEALVAAAHDAAAGIWRSARRRRGPVTVLLGNVSTTVHEVPCRAGAGTHDVGAVLVAVGTVLDGSSGTAAARAVADRLGRVVVAVGAA